MGNRHVSNRRKKASGSFCARRSFVDGQTHKKANTQQGGRNKSANAHTPSRRPRHTSEQMARTRTTIIPKNVPAGFTGRALSMFNKKFPNAHIDARPQQKVSLLLRTHDGQAFYKQEQLQFKKAQLYAMSRVRGFRALPLDAQSTIMGLAWE